MVKILLISAVVVGMIAYAIFSLKDNKESVFNKILVVMLSSLVFMLAGDLMVSHHDLLVSYHDSAEHLFVQSLVQFLVIAGWLALIVSVVLLVVSSGTESTALYSFPIIKWFKASFALGDVVLLILSFALDGLISVMPIVFALAGMYMLPFLENLKSKITRGFIAFGYVILLLLLWHLSF